MHMKATMDMAAEQFQARMKSDVARAELQEVEGVLQRVNYRTGEFKMVTPGNVMQFKLDGDSQLWFDDRQAILRCFHPLDPIRVIFQPSADKPHVRAIYSWEKVYMPENA
jgi:hypothetical protein